MGTLVRVLSAGISYFCVATLLAEAGMVGYLWSQGWLDRSKLAAIVGLVQHGDLPTRAAGESNAFGKAAGDSLEDIESAQSVRLRQFELREQATDNVLKQVRFETEQLTLEKERFDRVYESFKSQLGQDRVTAVTKGSENARLLLESIKPKQSKELIMAMLDADEIDEVVTLFGAMPIVKRAKIAAEFKTEEETKKLDEILRRIRQGLPDSAIIDETQQALDQPTSQSPGRQP